MLFAAQSAQSVSWGVELRRKWRAKNSAAVRAPDHLLTASRIPPLRSILMTWQRFDATLQHRLEQSGGRRIFVCWRCCSNPPVPIYHVHGLIW